MPWRHGPERRAQQALRDVKWRRSHWSPSLAILCICSTFTATCRRRLAQRAREPAQRPLCGLPGCRSEGCANRDRPPRCSPAFEDGLGAWPSSGAARRWRFSWSHCCSAPPVDPRRVRVLLLFQYRWNHACFLPRMPCCRWLLTGPLAAACARRLCAAGGRMWRGRRPPPRCSSCPAAGRRAGG